jgi:LAO/AO transport system kinase
VNKSDREGAHAVVRELRTMISLGDRRPGDWKPPVLSLVAITEEGIPALMQALEAFRSDAESSGRWQQRRLAQARRQVESLLLARLRQHYTLERGNQIERLARAVRDGRLDVYSAAEELLDPV